jgi:hypothetical protein
VRREVAAEGFSLREKVRLGVLPADHYLKDQATSEVVGEGELILDRGGLRFVGRRSGEAFSFHLSTDEVPTYGMCTDVTRFYTFHKGEFYEFYPERESTAKWLLATEELHRLNGGRWKDFPEALRAAASPRLP